MHGSLAPAGISWLTHMSLTSSLNGPMEPILGGLIRQPHNAQEKQWARQMASATLVHMPPAMPVWHCKCSSQHFAANTAAALLHARGPRLGPLHEEAMII